MQLRLVLGVPTPIHRGRTRRMLLLERPGQASDRMVDSFVGGPWIAAALWILPKRGAPPNKRGLLVDLLEAWQGAQIVVCSGTAAQTSSSPRRIYYYVAVHTRLRRTDWSRVCRVPVEELAPQHTLDCSSVTFFSAGPIGGLHGQSSSRFG